MICTYVTNNGVLCPAITYGTHILFIHETNKWTYIVDAKYARVYRAKTDQMKNLKYSVVYPCKKDARDLSAELTKQGRAATRYEKMVLSLALDERKAQ